MRLSDHGLLHDILFISYIVTMPPEQVCVRGSLVTTKAENDCYCVKPAGLSSPV